MTKRLEDMTEVELKAQMQGVAKVVKHVLPPDTGFIVLASSFGGGIAQYVSNVERDDAVYWMLETIQRWMKKDYIPRVGK